ncbi:MAG TPA: recombination mediator RecR [Sandaracinaceae bacterium LLY-WYZ-13_1]|nr:recombination mediator RecR [Sandaracinaceae bacterium LLY-WYZ-13_1]
MHEDDPIEELVALLARLPGIGARTATRLAHHVLAGEPEYAVALGRSLEHIHERVRQCERCGNFCADTLCRICRDPKREETTICVVARVPDLSAIEKSGTFRGRYHVLHGLLAPLDGVGPDQLPLDGLVERVKTGEVEEIVAATPLSVEGEATALYVAQVLRPHGVRVSRIASGIPHGGELEYADQVTVGRAFEGRREL